MPRRKEPRIPDAVLDQLLAGADPNVSAAVILTRVADWNLTHR